MDNAQTFTAFEGERLLASGSQRVVALSVKAAMRRNGSEPILAFDNQTGRQIDFDLRGSDEEIVARLEPRINPADDTKRPLGQRSPGRPKLGVVAREVTLLPRHWEWLAEQPGGASVTLRKLVDAARRSGDGSMRQAQQAADRFMAAMLGNRKGYEDAARALYAGDQNRFLQLTEEWPLDLRNHARGLAKPAFASTASETV